MARFQYAESEMLSAINAVENGMSINSAAKTFNVPRMTLSDKCKGKTPIIRKMGPSSVLTEAEEAHLAKWILHLGDMGFPVSKDQLLDSVQMLLKRLQRPNPFTQGKPGRHWYEAFLKRHPNLSKRVSQNLTRTRPGVSEENIRNWFREIKKYYVENGLLDIIENSPNRIFNCDETAFFLSPSNNTVIVRKGQKIVHNIINSDEKECITTLIMGNASGELAPPMVVVNLKRVPKTFAESVPSFWGVGRSDNGWITGQTFYEYIANVFHPWLIKNQIEFPVILYLDGHVSHLTLALSEFCSENKIELVALYPNSTHFLQPMDVAVFHPLKSAWKKEVYNWRIANSGSRLKRDNFCPLLYQVLKSSIKDTTLKNGFRACGLYPLDPNAITYFKTRSNDERLQPQEEMGDNLGNISKHIKFIESQIDAEKLTLFNNSGSAWNGNIEDSSLFYFWLGIKNKIVTEKETPFQLTPPNQSDLEQLLGNKDILCFNLNMDGTLEESMATDIEAEAINNENIGSISALSTEDVNKIGFSSGIGTYSDTVRAIGIAEVDGRNIELEDNPQTPQKTQSASVVSQDIPSPFKNTLFWPETSKTTQKKTREKVPSVATSKEWKEYHLKKEHKKLQKQNEIEERKRKRQEQKDSKVKDEKKKKKPTYTENNSNWFCHICEENIIENMIQCMNCKKWLHEKCGNVKPSTKKYFCSTCVL